MPGITRILLVSLLALLGCRSEQPPTATVFLTNQSRYQFDKSEFEVFINDALVLRDSVPNHYLSFHWADSAIAVARPQFLFRVAVHSNGYTLEKDTAITYQENMKIFVTFAFSPYYKRYRNPRIYENFPAETSRFKEVVDSLYAHGLVRNAAEYLNDTIPLPQHLSLTVK